RQIIEGLYYPQNLYEYSLIPVEILGQVYEQFLGKQIILKPRHVADVVDKPEVRKAGGVYYTPSYIVDYIVEHTVGKLVEGKTPEQIKTLRIVDPACGSGSFLLGAYQYLLDWYLTWYKKDGVKKHQREVCEDLQEGYRLTLRERKRILLAHVFGVDIDAQAVEVTKLSLVLKVLEGETQESVQTSLKFRERLLPDLGKNIQCGNSLIGTDFYKDHPDLTDEERKKINPFDWKKAFPAVFKDGGFDAVIGNPPYVNMTATSISSHVLNYYDRYYHVLKTAQSKNIFSLFVEKGVHLTAQDGIFSFIVPEGLARTRSYSSVRELIFKLCGLESLLFFEKFVFEKATIGSVVFVVKKGKAPCCYTVTKLDKNLTVWESHKLPHADIGKTPDYTWRDTPISDADVLVSNMERTGIKAGEIVRFYKGMVIRERTRVLRGKAKRGDMPFLLGNCMSRYHLGYKYYTNYKELDIIGGTKVLAKHKEVPRILVRRTGDYVCATMTDEPQLVESTIYIVCGASRQMLCYLLGLLNSRLLTFVVRNKAVTNKQAYPQILMTDLQELPIRTINFKDKADKSRHDKMVRLVERMLKLHKDAQAERVGTKQEAIEREIRATDEEIDRLVYELYGLTDEEIRIVEGEEKKS
ncbi:MAG: N-6 DNA methylase, partial [bacterium]|nr:N-6 DNA methylase [bacterium]